MTTDAAMMLGKGILNSIITAFGGDSLDVVTPDDMPEESIEFLRRMLVHYSDKDKRLAEAKGTSFADQLEDYYNTGVTSYQMLNQFGKVSNLFRMKEDENEAAASLKYILGRFTVKEVEEDGIQGFRIYDKYDFKNNEKYFASIYPEIYQYAKDNGYDTSAVDAQVFMTSEAIKKNLAKPDSNTLKAIGHPILRTIGGWFVSDEREEDKKIKINFFIPREKVNEPLENDTVMPVKYFEENILPEARPENFAAIIPNGPMDKQRANNLEDFYNSFTTTPLSFVSKAQAEEIKEQDIVLPQTKPNVKKQLSAFQEAFASARAKGEKTFAFTNKAGETKEYTTEVK